MDNFPFSCDTFVALPPNTENGCVIFGKNSDRPSSEVQEVIYVPSADHDEGAKLSCTYISIEQISHTFSVILSKPAWMWGAEMGANEFGVCIGNEAIFTKHFHAENDLKKRLLGMDLVRLGLERSKTAEQALQVIIDLLDKYGQGGPCFEDPSRRSLTYFNSFLIADPKEAFILETSGKHWATFQVKSGTRNISNLLTITVDIYSHSENLKDEALKYGWWKPNTPFNFAECYNLTPPSGASASVTTASQVSVLKRNDQGQLECTHYFTATPNPLLSVFKPFTFGPNVDIGSKTRSPPVTEVFNDEVPDRRHELYAIHSKLKPLPDDSSARVNIDVDVMSNQIRLERELLTLNWPLSNVVFREAVDIELSIYECITSEDESVRSSISNIMQKANHLSLNY
ncbi:DgyrCDS6686 [Dimorphilus gyrociliatus]|uniref:DgyrCDS6686 n=1 Tax=Dimorphilus gyrociliatus TaxID=2664684 RepID=A0A7I8VTK9_9ANNE|nr:DgyrCDS6686 [Dimorphilus gyrociliatus]